MLSIKLTIVVLVSLRSLRSLLHNCKDIGVILFAILGISGFVIFLVFYFENEFNYRAKLSNILVPPTKTALEEF